MQHQEVVSLAEKFLSTMPEQVTEMLADVELVIANTPEEATAALAGEFEDGFEFEAFPADMRGVFIGEPAEVEEEADTDSGDMETVLSPDGFIVLCAENLEDADQVAIVLMHEIGHALGMDEQEVNDLGLGIEKKPEPESKPDAETLQ